MTSALKELLIELEEVKLTHVNSCVFMAKLLGGCSLYSVPFDSYLLLDLIDTCTSLIITSDTEQ